MEEKKGGKRTVSRSLTCLLIATFFSFSTLTLVRRQGITQLVVRQRSSRSEKGNPGFDKLKQATDRLKKELPAYFPHQPEAVAVSQFVAFLESQALPDAPDGRLETYLTIIIAAILFLLSVSAALLWFLSSNNRSAQPRRKEDMRGERRDSLHPLEAAPRWSKENDLAPENGLLGVLPADTTVSSANENRSSYDQASSLSGKQPSIYHNSSGIDAKLIEVNAGQVDLPPPVIVDRSEFETTVKAITQNLEKLSAEVQARKLGEERNSSAEIRLFCIRHKLGFRLPRGNRRIVCPLGFHFLGREWPYEGTWFYCCDCQRFWPYAQASELPPNACPCCDRRFVRGYLCDRCHVLSMESDTLVRDRKYTITEKGVSPYCPGCLMQPLNRLGLHQCLLLKAGFSTARQECLLCKAAVAAPS